MNANGRRRRFTAKEKLAILEEGRQTGASISEVCRRHGIPSGQYYQWEKTDRRTQTETGPGATEPPGAEPAALGGMRTEGGNFRAPRRTSKRGRRGVTSGNDLFVQNSLSRYTIQWLQNIADSLFKTSTDATSSQFLRATPPRRASRQCPVRIERVRSDGGAPVPEYHTDPTFIGRFRPGRAITPILQKTRDLLVRWRRRGRCRPQPSLPDR